METTILAEIIKHLEEGAIIIALIAIVAVPYLYKKEQATRDKYDDLLATVLTALAQNTAALSDLQDGLGLKETLADLQRNMRGRDGER